MRSRFLLLASVGLLVGCGESSSGSDTVDPTTTTSATTTASATTIDTTESGDLTSGFQQASWGANVTVTYENGVLHYISDGIPNHERDVQYAVPTGGVVVPDASTATATDDPTVAQTYDYSIPLTPTKAATVTSTSLGVIGLMISGASLFNPYEGDGATVATQSNFSVKDASGNDVWFLDDCAGHPTPMGQYHYHALPKCVTATVDETNGASHIIGIAFDGYPIYGDRDINGNQLTAADLDECNGITSPTPEFPGGVYHYVLLDVADSTSSIRCFSGVVDESITSMAAMPGMGAP
ncbi:MAG: YHYH protein [Actinomycetia bacterium]|nr:YHYH protein [Actinomycetes bacterium]